jgi:hypothetical protein
MQTDHPDQEAHQGRDLLWRLRHRGRNSRSAPCLITLGSSPCRGLARPHSTVPGVGRESQYYDAIARVVVCGVFSAELPT